MLNKCILVGRLVADPELKFTPQNVSVVTFTLAVDRNYAKGEEKKADFINCVAWRNTADFVAKFFQKGQMMALCGSLQVRSWDDAQGNKRYATEVIADEVHFCGSKSEETPQDTKPKVDFVPVEVDGDLPF